jgi:hypothetical protein
LVLVVNESNSGTVVDWIYKRNFNYSTTVFEKVFWSLGDLIVKVLSTIDHLSVLMAYIYTGVMIGSYLLWLFFYANNGIFPLAFTIINK